MELTLLGTSWIRNFLIPILLAGLGLPKPENRIIIHLDEGGGDQAPPAVGQAMIGKGKVNKVYLLH